LLQGEPDIQLVGEAADGREAIKLTRRLRPDLILMDVTMPIMTGIEATRVIHAEMPAVCVIGLSTFLHDQQAEAMRDAGAMDSVTKSAPPEELLVVLRACYMRIRREPSSAATP